MLKMVSNEEGERVRTETDKKASDLRDLLKGATVMDVNFKSVWMNQRPVEGLVLEKDGRMFLLTVESEASWEGSTIDWIEVMDVKTREVLSGEDGQ
jgi:hypothetical protein